MEIANYISGQYRLDYEQRKTAKLKAERESLMKRHVAEIVSQQQSKQEAFDMLSRGIRRSAMELRIENPPATVSKSCATLCLTSKPL